MSAGGFERFYQRASCVEVAPSPGFAGVLVAAVVVAEEASPVSGVDEAVPTVDSGGADGS